MYADLPPPKNQKVVKTEEEAEEADAAEVGASGGEEEEEEKEKQPRKNTRRSSENSRALQTKEPELLYGVQLPEWVREPRCQLVLEEIKDDVVLSRISMHERPAYVIGRERNGVDLQLLHPTISRRHALVVHGVPPETPAAYRPMGVTIVDLKSSAGTFVRRGIQGRKRKLTPGASVVLRDEMVFQFGSSTRMYRVLGTKEDPLKSTVPDTLSRLSKLAEARDEGDVEIAHPKELHPAVKKRLEAAEEKPELMNPFRLSSVKEDESSDMAPRPVAVNQHFRSSLLGKRTTSETAFSNQASQDTVFKERMRQRARLAQRAQEQIIERSDGSGVTTLEVQSGIGPSAQVPEALRQRGDKLRQQIVSQHLQNLEQREDGESVAGAGGGSEKRQGQVKKEEEER